MTLIATDDIPHKAKSVAKVFLEAYQQHKIDPSKLTWQYDAKSSAKETNYFY